MFSPILQSAFNAITGPARIHCIAAHLPAIYILASHTDGPVVELGAGASTLALLAGCAEKGTKLVSYDSNPETKKKVFSYSKLSETDPVWNLWTHVTGDSVAVAKDWNNNTVSLLFIDTNHSYSVTTNELNAWYPKMKRGESAAERGIICGHDYYLKRFKEGNVDKAVNEFMEKHKDEFFLQVLPNDQGLFILWPAGNRTNG